MDKPVASIGSTNISVLPSKEGAAKYSEHNVDLGIPAHSLVDSGLRHIRKFMCGETDEDHLVAAVWNFMWLLEMRTTHPELMDIPWRPNEEKEG